MKKDSLPGELYIFLLRLFGADSAVSLLDSPDR